MSQIFFDTLYHSVTGYKIFAMVSVAIVSLVGTFSPLFLLSCSANFKKVITDTAKYLTAGILLGVGLIHMLPAATRGLHDTGVDILANGKHFPLSFAIAAVAFVLVWFIEKRGELAGSEYKHERLMAMTVQAEKMGGCNICFVQVETVASYGPASCTAIHSDAENTPNLTPACQSSHCESHSEPLLSHSKNEETSHSHSHSHSHSYDAHSLEVPLLPHNHDWNESKISGIPGGSKLDRCSALHLHSHESTHSHIMIPGQSGMSYILASLFSIHSFIFGAALGASTSVNGTLTLLVALLAHKGAEAFAVGAEFVKEEVSLGKAVTVLLLYCSMTPLGVTVGMAASLLQGTTGKIVANFVQAFGAGTVLFIVMHQLEGKDEGQTQSRWKAVKEVLLFLSGLGLMILVSLV